MLPSRCSLWRTFTLPCEAWKGKRFKHDILEVRYGGKDIDDVLNMTVNEAIEFFSDEKTCSAM